MQLSSRRGTKLLRTFRRYADVNPQRLLRHYTCGLTRDDPYFRDSLDDRFLIYTATPAAWWRRGQMARIRKCIGRAGKGAVFKKRRWSKDENFVRHLIVNRDEGRREKQFRKWKTQCMSARRRHPVLRQQSRIIAN